MTTVESCRRNRHHTPEEQAFLEPIEQEMKLRGYSPTTRKFYYQHVRRQPVTVEQRPRPRKEKKRPVVLSRNERFSLSGAIGYLKHQSLLMLVY